VQPRFHGKTLRHDAHVPEATQEPPKLADAELEQDWRILVFQRHLHQLREGVQPRHPVVDLENRVAARLEDAPALGDEALRVRRVLDDAVRVDQIEGLVRKRQVLSAGDLKVAGQPLLLKIGFGELDGGRGHIDPARQGASAREPRQIDGGAAAHLEDPLPRVSVEANESRQVMEFLEVVLVEVVEESPGADGMLRDLEIVDARLPVVAHFLNGRHADHYTNNHQRSRFMTRDPAALSAHTFDMLVVGGGIYGLAVAYDAAQRGLRVALIERDDFGGGNSFNHARTIHGGLRYLQHLDLGRSRESIRERRTLAQIAPHAVSPMPFVLPLVRSLLKGPMAMRAGFLVDRAVGRDRNRGIDALRRLPPGRVLSHAQAIERYPGLPRKGLTGAAVWYDYVTPEADRLTFSWALAASAHGALLANYVEAAALLVDGRRVVGVKAIDRVNDRVLEIGARLTINAAGSGVDRLLEPLGVATGLRFLKAMNLVTRREAGDAAIGARAPSGRHFFLVPYRGRALFSTWESPRPIPSDDAAVHERDVAAFISELNQAYPALDLTATDVSMVHRGVVPATVASDGSASLDGHEHVHDHAAAEGPRRLEGIISVVGTKYTTARGVAERVVDRAVHRLRPETVPCRTASTPLPGGAIRDHLAALAADARREFDSRFSSDTIAHVIAGYGSQYREVLTLSEPRPEWSLRVDESSPVVAGQLVWAARHEMVVTLQDVVMRRTPLGAMGFPGDAAVERAAAIVAGELGWSEKRRQVEIRALSREYGAGQGTLKASKT